MQMQHVAATTAPYLKRLKKNEILNDMQVKKMNGLFKLMLKCEVKVL